MYAHDLEIIRVLLNETLEFHFWGFYIFVDLHLEIENKNRRKLTILIFNYSI